jgi:hypothetical protein
VLFVPEKIEEQEEIGGEREEGHSSGHKLNIIDEFNQWI